MPYFKIITIKKELLNLFSFDKEMKIKDDRPHLLVIKLKYKNNTHEFAIPIVSNVKKNVRFKYKLPKRPGTKKGCVHAIHFEKMIPIEKSYYGYGYRINKKILSFVKNNFSDIYQKAQDYLYFYEKNKSDKDKIKDIKFSTDIDEMIRILEKNLNNKK
jgi:hypothetical protein